MKDKLTAYPVNEGMNEQVGSFLIIDKQGPQNNTLLLSKETCNSQTVCFYLGYNIILSISRLAVNSFPTFSASLRENFFGVLKKRRKYVYIQVIEINKVAYLEEQ